MEPTFTSKPAFTAVGLMYRGKNETKKEIPQLWEQLVPRMQEIKYVSTPRASYGVMGNYDPATGEFDYLASMGVDRVDDLPQGMQRWDVPAQHYAVFECTLKTISPTYDFIYQQWLPQSGRQHGDGPEFELYDEHFQGDDSTFYIYIPVK